jgi:hypothetical protein
MPLVPADPAVVHPMPGQPRVVLLKPLVTSPLIEVGEFSYYDDPQKVGLHREATSGALSGDGCGRVGGAVGGQGHGAQKCLGHSGLGVAGDRFADALGQSRQGQVTYDGSTPPPSCPGEEAGRRHPGPHMARRLTRTRSLSVF